MDLSPITAALLFCGVILSAIALYALQHRSSLGAKAFSVLMFGIAVYVLGYGMELASQNLETAMFWSKVQYAGILIFPTTYLIFVVQFIGQGSRLTPAKLGLLFTLPAVLFLVKLYDDDLRLIYSVVELESAGPLALLQIERGPLYQVIVIYSLIIVTYANYLLIRKRAYSSHLFREQTAIIIGAALVIYLVIILYLAGIQLFPHLPGFDLNAIAYIVWAGAICYAILRFRLFDLVPIARDALIEMLNDGVIVLDAHGRVVDANPVALKIFNWQQTPIGKTAGEILPGLVDQDFLAGLEKTTKIETTLSTGAADRTYEVTFSTLREKRSQFIGSLIVIHDITERKAVERELRELSLLDELTGLTNRRGFNVLSNQLIRMADRMQLNAALFYIDLDRLKQINDGLGHAAGDQAIKAAAGILKRTFRSSDIIARFGGDEFVILAIESGGCSANVMLERLRAELEQQSAADGEYKVSFSVGVAVYEWDNPQPIESLLARADQAMYAMKQTRRAGLPDPS